MGFEHGSLDKRIHLGWLWGLKVPQCVPMRLGHIPHPVSKHYRLVVALAYKLGVVYVKFIGTHKEYDLIDAETVEM